MSETEDSVAEKKQSNVMGSEKGCRFALAEEKTFKNLVAYYWVEPS